MRSSNEFDKRWAYPLFLLLLVVSLTIAVPVLGAEKPLVASPGDELEASPFEEVTSSLSDATPVRARWGTLPRAFRVVALASSELQAVLSRAPMDPRSAGGFSVESTDRPRPVVAIPLPMGGVERIAIEESPILSPALEAQYPRIRTYRGVGVDDPTLTATLDQTPLGFHAQLLSDRGTVYVDPVEGPWGPLYISYWGRDAVGEPFSCGVTETSPVIVPRDKELIVRPEANPSGTQLRTYRLAVSATGEYTTRFGGAAAAMAQITTTMNRVSGIYERDLAIRFNLVATRIFDDPATDPFTGDDTDVMRGENQAELDANVGNGNYDIGHALSQGGGGGIASLGVACSSGNKARGATSRGNPSGDAFDVDYVAHEMGHQMGADHTFNGNASDNCSDNRVGSSAYEPGGGTTIMAYAGICGADDIQANSDDYFHTRSFDQIRAYQAGGGACGTVTATGNTVPSVSAGPDYTIPRDTAFRLTGSGSDPNPDTLTYNWEQYDLGAAAPGPPSSTDNGPLFRSRPSSSSATRVMPRMADLLANSPTPWEVLPTIDRDLNFRLTVRDNRADGGGSDWDQMVVHVSGAPFAITSPTTGSNLECGVSETLQWNVGGSTAANVTALLSTDGASSFPPLIGSTANDGSQSFTTPTTLTTTAWLELRPIGNIYFSLEGPMTIRDTLDPTVTAPSDISGFECTQCSPQGAAPPIGSATATDACDASLTLADNAPSIFPLGTTTVTWMATDDSGNSDVDTQDVEVVDTTPPGLIVPGDVQAECTGPSGTPVALGDPTVSDVCWCSVSLGNDAPATFPLGSTTVTWTATDGSSNASSDTQQVTVVDTTPPVLEVTVTPSQLWPPQHQMVPIHATIIATDICDASPTVELVSITSNQPDDDLGDGAFVDDVQEAAFGTDDRDFLLRAERSGTGEARFYTIVYRATDGSGNSTDESVIVVVTRSRRR